MVNIGQGISGRTGNSCPYNGGSGHDFVPRVSFFDEKEPDTHLQYDSVA